MNNVGVTFGTTKSYVAAQSALQPVGETLQVCESLDSLREVVEFNLETVRALLRRLEPVTGEVVVGSLAFASGAAKVQMALMLDTQRDLIATVTAEVQAAIRALQI